MVFNATFNYISVISWWSVLLVEETGVPVESHRPATSHWQTLTHNVVSSTPLQSGIRTQNVRLLLTRDGTLMIFLVKSYFIFSMHLCVDIDNISGMS